MYILKVSYFVIQQEDLAYLHQQLFSTATEVVSAGGAEATIVDTTAATVTMLHDGMHSY